MPSKIFLDASADPFPTICWYFFINWSSKTTLIISNKTPKKKYVFTINDITTVTDKIKNKSATNFNALDIPRPTNPFTNSKTFLWKSASCNDFNFINGV